ncbi:MAG: S41 family peptidase [Bacteroidota bacterium]
MRLILLITIVVLSLADCFSQKPVGQEKLLEDFDYAVKELKLQHQGFYNYTSKEVTDSQIEELRRTIDKPTTKLAFYQLIRRLVAVMNEGHGSVDLPKLDVLRIGLTRSFLPLTVKFLDGQLIVTQNFGEDVDGLSKGTRIISVNGESMEDIRQNLSPLIATDGFNETSIDEWLGSVNFSLLYRLVYGQKSNFVLQVEDYQTKAIKKVTISPVRFSAFKVKNAKYERFSPTYTKFALTQINDSIAYLCVPDFGLGAIDYESFYKSSFQKIDALGIGHLIIDIQANTGGEEGNENLLYSYLSHDRLRKYRKVTMLPIPFQKRKNYKSIQLDKWAQKDAIAERGEFTLYSDYYSELGYSLPDSSDVYHQKLYVLTSGLTFSGGAEFASMIRMSQRGILVGEETGGAYEGNVSSFNETIQLPNTRIRIDIPIVHFQINVSLEQIGRGVIPDAHVVQTWDDYMKQRNAKLEYALNLIMNDG